MDLDVIVVGANVAGASMARELAHRNLRVLMLERQPASEVGSKSCGDGIERYQFERLGLEVPDGDYILRDVGVAYLSSPDKRHRLRGEAAGIAMERFGLNQHLLTGAIDGGVELQDLTEAVAPMVEGNRVVGVRCQPRNGGETSEVRAPVTVDATGWRGILRRQLPSDWPVAEKVPREEMAIAYREERQREEPVAELKVEATFDFEIAPGGLYWVADRTDVLVNVGIGMQWLADLPNPRTMVRERVLPMYPDIQATSLIRAGGGIIPNRRPIDCPVAAGFVVIGDAACQVQPLSGSGIGASMYAAKLAAVTITRALESTRSPSTADLFPYAHAYNSTYGADQAANQMLRTSLQALTNAQLNRLLGARVVSEEDLVSAARTGRLDMGFGGKLKAATKLLGEPRLVRALARMRSNMESARSLYEEYPDNPATLDAWRRRASDLLQRA
jgi:digeranylgeranylglycerophospholipid reductase